METLKILEKIAYRHYITQVFEDFLHMSVAAFCMGQAEERYLSVAKKYNSEELKLFSQALAVMHQDYDKVSDTAGVWDDILGRIFEEVNSKSNASNMGQFFTPKSICDLMAQMLKEDKKVTVADPTCGSSRNLIAHSRLDPSNRLNCVYYGFDLDMRCCLMSVLNFLMYGMKGYVIHMNTLSMELYSGWRIWLPETGMFVTPLSIAQCWDVIAVKNVEQKQLIKPIEPTIESGKQLTLF